MISLLIAAGVLAALSFCAGYVTAALLQALRDRR